MPTISSASFASSPAARAAAGERGASIEKRSMAGRSFLDSSLLAYTDDAGSARKQAVAIDLVAACRRNRDGVVSPQVLQEYFVVSTRKLGVDPELARRKVELFGQLHLVPTGLEDVLAA